MKTSTHLRLRDVCLTCIMTFMAFQAVGADAYKTLPPELDGTMMPINLEECDTLPVWDNTLTPVGGVYVSRHGARFLSSSHKVDELLKDLEEARAAGTLTAAGDDFISLLDSVRRHTAARWGALSDVGKQEQHELARQFHNLMPALADTAHINARSTYVPRVVMTMYEFCHTLDWLSNRVDISTAEGHRFDSLLRFFRTDSVYASYISDGGWRKIFDDFERRVAPEAPAKALIGEASPGHLRKVTLRMYDVLQGMRAVGLPAPTTRWMSEDDYRRCWEVDNLDHYLLRSSNEVSDIAAKSAGVLLEAIISSLDAQAAGCPTMDFFFGHAETVMPLFALMKLPGCFFPELKAEDVAGKWKDWQVSPLGANMLIVLLKSGDGKFYASVRLNGRFVCPLPGQGKVVAWPELRAFYK